MPDSVTLSPSSGVWRTFDDARAPLPLADYVRANRARLVVVVVAALVAAEAVVGFQLLQPREFSAAATVTIPTAGSTPFEVGRTVARYRSVVGSESVLRDVAREERVSLGALRDGVSVSREGTSRYVRVSFTGERRADVPSLARSVAVGGLEALFRPAFRSADRALLRAQADMDALRAEVAQFNAKNGLVVDAPQLLRQRASALANARAEGNSRAAARLQDEVDVLTRIAAQFAPMETRQKELQRALNKAAAKRAEARANLEASKSRSAVGVGEAHDTTTAARLLTLGVVSFVVLLPLLFLASVLWSRLVRRGQP